MHISSLSKTGHLGLSASHPRNTESRRTKRPENRAILLRRLMPKSACECRVVGHRTSRRNKMRFSLLTAGTALLLCQSVAMAQTNTHPKDTTAEPSANATTSAPGSIGSQMRDSLQKAGFSNIRMVPSSFVISATDKDGNPVVMTVTPVRSPRSLNRAGKAQNQRRRDRKIPQLHRQGLNSYLWPTTTSWARN